MGLNVGVRHKKTTQPKTFTVPKTNTDRIQSGLDDGVRRRNQHYRIILLYQTTDDRISTLRGFGVALVLKWGSLGSPGTKWVIHLPTHDVPSNF
jgi:hypothetical protein